MDVTFADATASLIRTPAALEALFAGLTDPWLEGDEGPDTWSPLETLMHMVHVEPTWMARLGHIARHGDSSPFPLVDRANHRDVLGHLNLAQLLDAFAEERTRGLADLATIDFDPDTPALHAELGPVRMGNLVAAWVTHDHNHLGQIVKTMAKQYREAIGPWRQFLPIVDAD